MSKKILLVILFLLTAEAYLRFGMNPRFVLDDKFLFTLSKNCRYIRTNFRANGGEKIVVRTNSSGYRGEEINPKKNNKRVVVYGDSFILGDFSHIEDTFCKQLEKLMRSDIDPNIEVINAGVAGYGPDQISLKLEEELKTLDPDLVIIAVYSGNDFGDLLRNKIYRIDENGQIKINNYVLDKKLVNKFHKNISLKTPRILLVFRSFLMDFTGYIGNGFPNRVVNLKNVINVVKTVSSRAGVNMFHVKKRSSNTGLKELKNYIVECVEKSGGEYNEVMNGDYLVKNLFDDHYDADMSTFPEKVSSQYKARLMSGVILKISNTLETEHIPYIFLFIPSPIDVCDHYDCWVDTVMYPGYDSSILTDILEEIAVKNKLNYINLYQYFDKKDPDSLYFRHGNNHWNKKGQQLAAEIVKDYLIEKEVMQDENSDVTII